MHGGGEWIIFRPVRGGDSYMMCQLRKVLYPLHLNGNMDSGGTFPLIRVPQGHKSRSGQCLNSFLCRDFDRLPKLHRFPKLYESLYSK